MTAEPVRHEVDLEVRYAETDQMGVVHHANYLVWFELARTHLCAAAGHPYADIERSGVILMVSAAELRYRLPARYGERVRVACWMTELRSRSLRFAYEVRRAGELLVSGTTDHLWVRRDSGRVCSIPEALRVPFSRLAGESS